jgi:hypothetical protein
VALPASPPPAVRVSIDDLGVVSTWIDGKGPYHFALDTGAGILVVTPEFAKKSGLRGDTNDTAMGVAGNTQIQRLTIDDVRVGGADVTSVPAAIIPLPPGLTYQGHYGTIDGLIGYTFLSHFATTIDYASHAVTFTRPEAYMKPQPATRVKLEVHDGAPLVDASADGHEGLFQLDTGDNAALTLAAPFVAKFDITEHYPKSVPMIAQGVGGASHSVVVRLANFTIAGTTIDNEPASLSQATAGVFSQDSLAGNVGVETLRRFIFTIDYQDSAVDFTPTKHVADFNPFRQSGILMTRRADGLFDVNGVIAKTPAAEAGLHSGETIVAIGGVDVKQMDAYEVQQAIRGDSVVLTIRDGTATRRVTLHPRELLPV